MCPIKNNFSSLLIVFISWFTLPGVLFAREPVNLQIAKNAVIRYHDSGEYQKDIAAVTQQAKKYLCQHLTQVPVKGTPAIILDIDETALSNYKNLRKEDFGGTLAEIIRLEKLGGTPAIKPTLELFRYAKAHRVSVFFVTGRLESERQATIRNLHSAGYKNWDGLILRNQSNQHTSAQQYKTAVRRKLAHQGYHIILNIGDQQSDLIGGYAEKSFKLPDPFYYIP